MDKNRHKPIYFCSTFLVLLLVGLTIRVDDFDAFQIGDRQFRSAIIARAYYYESAEFTPEWKRQVAEISLQRAGILEPPIMELFVSWIYKLIDRVHLWIPRVLSSVFWVVGGIFLYKIVELIICAKAALFAMAYYLFVPMGIYISTGFVPDSLMIMMYLLSLFMIIQYYEQSSLSRLAFAAIVSGLAVLVKPFCLFAIFGVFILLAIYKKGGWRRAIDLHLITFLGITILPSIYYAYGVLVGGSLSKQAQTSFLLNLLLTRSFWRDSILTASGVVGFTPLIVALIGLPMMSEGRLRVLLIGLWVGYAVFGVVFTYHIQFGPHYHSQLIVIVAISIGFLLALISNHIMQSLDKWYTWLPVLTAVGLVLLFNLREVHGVLGGSRHLDDEALYQEIGEIVHHSTNTIFLAPYYGTPLEYYGELSGSYWPRNVSDRDRALGITRVRSVEERINQLNFSPEYFIITSFKEYYVHHSDLQEYLERNCSPFVESEEYLIYNDCTG